MCVFIELPTWLGDSVMASCAVENLTSHFKGCEVTFFGSYASVQLYQNHPNCKNLIIDSSRGGRFRILKLINLVKNLPKFDIAISFRSSFATKLAFKFIKSDKKAVFKKDSNPSHQVIKYGAFVSKFLGIKDEREELKLYFEPFKFAKATLGINPGASYGSAKRWYPRYFADVACALSDRFDVVIFGSLAEKEICDEIAEILSKNGVNFRNLCAQTTIKTLCEQISSLKLFITNDSGPMHIAAAFKVPTIALFGPTKFTQTSPFKNENAKILHLDLDCMPCMKRVCPLKTHECMKNLTPQMVLKELEGKI